MEKCVLYVFNVIFDSLRLRSEKLIDLNVFLILNYISLAALYGNHEADLKLELILVTKLLVASSLFHEPLAEHSGVNEKLRATVNEKFRASAEVNAIVEYSHMF